MHGDVVAHEPRIRQREIVTALPAYPQQLAKMLSLSIEDMTCSGATTTHVLHGGQYFQGPQIDALGEDTQLVMLTTGGNDISYIGDLTLLATRSRGGVIGSVLRL